MANYEVLPSTEDKKPRFFYGYIIVGAAFLIMVVMFGTMYSFGVFFKPVLTEFGWTRAATSGAYSLNMVLIGLLAIIAGRLTDRFGPRLVITACGLSLGLGYLLMSQVSAIWQLYLFFGVLVGIGTSGYVPLMSTVARWFVKRRGLMTGIAVSGIGAGTVIMPPVATQLISIYGWRTSYIIVGCVALVIIVIGAQFLRRDPRQVGQLPYGAGEVKAEGLDSGARGFSLQEAIRTGQFWIFSAAMFLFLFSQQTMMVHIVSHATDLGISAILAANILAIIGGLSIGGRIGMGSAGDRIGNKLAFIIIFILASVALFWLQVAQELWMLYLFAVVFGFAYGGQAALMSPIIAELFGLRAHGAVLGMLLFVTLIGGALGPLVTGRIFDVTDSYYLAFSICAGLMVIGLILVSLLKPPRREGLMGSV